VPPRYSCDEQHRHERREVDERRAQVGLGEDEQDGHESEPDDAQRRCPGTEGALPLDEHAREREHEQELPELRRLEGEEAEADPARRSVCRMPDQQDERDHHGGADEDRPPVAPVEVGIDERRDHEHDAAEARIEDLAVEVVARVAREGELRHAGDTPEPYENKRRDTDEQDPVERADDGKEVRRLALAAKSCPL
jgi:hypothetical protein